MNETGEALMTVSKRGVGAPCPSSLPAQPTRTQCTYPKKRNIWKPLHACLRRLAFGLGRLLPDDHRVCLMRSLRFERPIRDLHPEVRLHIGTEPELSRCLAAVKEPWTIQWIQQWIRPGDVVFDVGANVGAYAIYAGRLFEGRVRVFAFEPACSSYAALCQNIALNRCGDCVTPLPVLLGSRSGWIPFRYRSLESGHALHASGDRAPGKADHYKDGGPIYEQSMWAMTLDELCFQEKLPIPNHIKLDVDGAEAEVLLGASNVLRRPELRSVLVELAEEEATRTAAARLLREAGLRPFEHFRRAESGRPSYGLFVR